MRKKEYLAKILSVSGVHAACARFRDLAVKELPILGYHRILDIEHTAFPFDPSLVSASRADFAWQMQYVKKNYNPITFQALLDALDGKSDLPKRPVIVSFDDGFDDNYHHAFPILKSLDMPATFFVATGYIGSEKPFWFDLIAHILYQAPTGPMQVEQPALSLQLDDNVASRRAATLKLIRALKKITNQQRLDFFERFTREHDSVIDLTKQKMSRPMSWAQVREMSAAGIEFGSHTVTHPILSTVDDKNLHRELIDSRQKLEQELGKPISLLAYPIGEATAFNDNVITAAQSAGYRIGVSYVEGVNRLQDINLFRLCRQHVELHTSRDYFKGLLSLPEVFW
ncbi:MAG: polysaccharide deacetylase family protein [Gammaproteobacteria bacterium]|nr:polysaccharide deacetylase family protein [Gammaproteobacteria bacterium]